MRVIRTTFGLGLLFVSWLSAGHAAVTVLTHGHIYTGVPSRPWALAIAFRDDQIVAVGDDAAVLGKWRRSATRKRTGASCISRDRLVTVASLR